MKHNRPSTFLLDPAAKWQDHRVSGTTARSHDPGGRETLRATGTGLSSGPSANAPKGKR